MQSNIPHMFIVKRNGQKQPVQFDKITNRISRLVNKDERDKLIPALITQKVISSIYSGINTEEIDIEAAKICANMVTTHPLYGYLAGRILVSDLHKKTKNSFVDKMNSINKMNPELLDQEWLKWINNNSIDLEKIIDYSRDFNYDYFGFKTLERAYLIKDSTTNEIYERPQDMLLRVASFINMGNLEYIKITYDLMSKGNYTHASPTLFNSGTNRSQLSSCFLLNTNDSIEGITTSWDRVSKISKWAGGIGLHVSNIRAKGSTIRGTNGPSSGIVPMLQVYNNIARYINQGGKRKGSFAIYLEPHHPDIIDFLELKKNTGSDEMRARDLFYALWISDLFMKQVQEDKEWYFFCPDEAPGLNDVYGEEYENLYWKYVEEKRFKSTMKARKLMEQIMDSQLETGMPYMLYKDSINKKSNQKNIGVVKSSNLCAEIVEVSNNEEHAVCNLASIAINNFLEPFKSHRTWTIYTKEDCKYCKWSKIYMTKKGFKFIEKSEFDDDINKFLSKKEDNFKITYPQIMYGKSYIGGFDEMTKYTAEKYNYDKLYETAYYATINLDKVIDKNYYPTPETKCSNMRNRPIGLGIQGLADTLARMKINFESEEAVEFNKLMMETIYFAALNASCDISTDRQLSLEKVNISKFSDIPHYYDKNYFVNGDTKVNDNTSLEKDNMENRVYHKLKLNKEELSLKKYIGSYSKFEGSPISEGLFQQDMWENTKCNKDWGDLRERVNKYGVRNSLLTALMPTASTSQILGNNECFEWFTNNIYTRRTLAGDFPVINKHLVQDLINIGEWNEDVKNIMIADDGSVKLIKNIPTSYKNLYKTIWEIKQIWVLKNARARAPFVDQTQSMNIFMSVPDYRKLNSCHTWGWKNGLKTGMYYLRTNAAKSAIKFTVDPKLINKLNQEDDTCYSCSA
jgi:ribonucleoside-diphosphate reductase alpha subunit